MEGLNPQEGAQAPTQRVFDDSTMSKLNALGIDPSDSEAMSSLGISTEAPVTADPEAGMDNNSNSQLAAEGAEQNRELNTDGPSVEEQGQSTQPDSQEEPTTEEGSPENVAAAIVDHPIFGGKKDLGASKNPGPSDFEGADDVNQFISSKIDGISDVNSLVSNYQELNAQLEEYKVIKQEYDRIDQSFQNMPPELLKAIDMAEKGEDWKGALANSPNLDFGKDADSVDKTALIKAYFGDQFTAEDFEAANPDSDYHDSSTERLVNLAYSQAKDKFNADKKNNTLTLEQARLASEQKTQLYSESVSKSLGSVKSFIPDVSDEYLSSINQDFLESKQKSLFSNPDGTVKDDAALKYALAKDGVEIFQQLQKVIQDQAQTIANQELLARKSQTPPAGGGSTPNNPNNGIRQEVIDYVKNL